MPTYDFKCQSCGLVFEERAAVTVDAVPCEWCMGVSRKQFTPTTNICIPGAFKRDAGWNNAPGSTGEPWSRNNSVHAPQKTTFTQEFDKNWKAAGGS